MIAELHSESESVLQAALLTLDSKARFELLGPSTAGWSERCVEVPWFASFLRSPGTLLDVGWAMSPPEWVGVILKVIDRGSQVVGIDIIDPRRVQSRYASHQVQRVLRVSTRIESILEAQLTDSPFDTMTCISTLEHIGFDVASAPNVLDTAFVRGETPQEALMERDSNTDRRFMDAAHRLLRSGGSLLVSVPAGTGGPILHQDSLGLYTYQFEYNWESWRNITGDERFEVSEEALFSHDPAKGWHPVSSFDVLTQQTSALQPFATGCAMAHLVRR